MIPRIVWGQVLPKGMACLCLINLIHPGSVAEAANIALNADGIRFNGEAAVQQTAYLGPLANVVSVSAAGTDFTDPLSALASIPNTGSEAPAPDNPYVVLLGPGTYDLGGSRLQLRPYVSVIGAGEGKTIVQGTGATGSDDGVVIGADHATLSQLTVKCTGGASYSTAIFNNGSAPHLEQVTAIAAGGADWNVAIYNLGANPVMTHFTGQATGGRSAAAVSNNNASPLMTHVTATANGSVGGGGTKYGILNQSTSAPTMRYLTATVSGGSVDNAIYNDNSSPDMLNVVVTALGSIHSGGIVNKNGSNPIMINVIVTVSGFHDYVGVRNHASSPNILNLTARGTDVSDHQNTENYGIHNSSGAEPRMVNVNVYANGGYNTYGVLNNNASPYMVAMTASASNASENVGVYNHASSPVMLNVRASAMGRGFNRGIHVDSSSYPRLLGVIATAGESTGSFGLFLDGAILEAQGSTFQGETGGINQILPASRISDSLVIPGTLDDVSTTTTECRNVYDAALDDVVDDNEGTTGC